MSDTQAQQIAVYPQPYPHTVHWIDDKIRVAFLAVVGLVSVWLVVNIQSVTATQSVILSKLDLMDRRIVLNEELHRQNLAERSSSMADYLPRIDRIETYMEQNTTFTRYASPQR